MYAKREDRRDRTHRYAVRAWKVWGARMGNDPDRWGVGRYRKGKAIGCDCRGRKHGQPKRSTGCCYGSAWRPSAHERTVNRRLCRAWFGLLRAVDPLDVEV